jgi:site-specific DNA-methyltransferase (adenine-specific)
LWEKLSSVLEFHLPYDDINITFNAQLGFTDVWDDIDFYAERRTRVHPTQKPLPLIERLVLTSSNEGDLVLDPFMGSGTTAIASLQNRRNSIGFELDEKYWLDSMSRINEARERLIQK